MRCGFFVPLKKHRLNNVTPNAHPNVLKTQVYNINILMRGSETCTMAIDIEVKKTCCALGTLDSCIHGKTNPKERSGDN